MWYRRGSGDTGLITDRLEVFTVTKGPTTTWVAVLVFSSDTNVDLPTFNLLCVGKVAVPYTTAEFMLHGLLISTVMLNSGLNHMKKIPVSGLVYPVVPFSTCDPDRTRSVLPLLGRLLSGNKRGEIWSKDQTL